MFSFFVQVFVFTDGEVTDTFSVIKEVKFNSKKHRYEENVISTIGTGLQ
jgi:hypothetical protein